jgi:hypothetical protein
VSINISPGVVKDLVVYPDSNITSLVDEFATQNRLGKDERDKIYKELTLALESD